jgi:hypothetical protein
MPIQFLFPKTTVDSLIQKLDKCLCSKFFSLLSMYSMAIYKKASVHFYG